MSRWHRLLRLPHMDVRAHFMGHTPDGGAVTVSVVNGEPHAVHYYTPAEVRAFIEEEQAGGRAEADD